MKYFWNILISIDQFANVLFSPILNLFVRKGGAQFGYPDETLSSVFGKNEQSGHCKACNWVCRYILHPIDRNHCRKSVEVDEGN